MDAKEQADYLRDKLQELEGHLAFDATGDEKKRDAFFETQGDLMKVLHPDVDATKRLINACTCIDLYRFQCEGDAMGNESLQRAINATEHLKQSPYIVNLLGGPERANT